MNFVIYRSCNGIRTWRPNCAVSIHRFAFHGELNVTHRRVVHQLHEIISDGRRGDSNRLETELIEVIQHNRAVIAAEDKERIAVNLVSQLHN